MLGQGRPELFHLPDGFLEGLPPLSDPLAGDGRDPERLDLVQGEVRTDLREDAAGGVVLGVPESLLAGSVPERALVLAELARKLDDRLAVGKQGLGDVQSLQRPREDLLLPGRLVGRRRVPGAGRLGRLAPRRKVRRQVRHRLEHGEPVCIPLGLCQEGNRLLEPLQARLLGAPGVQVGFERPDPFPEALGLGAELGDGLPRRAGRLDGHHSLLIGLDVLVER